MSTSVTLVAGLDDGYIIPFTRIAHPNLKFTPGSEPERDADLDTEPGAHAPRPGGILIVALLSGLSGAIMGLMFGGYLTAALAMMISAPLGVGIGLWIRGLKD